MYGFNALLNSLLTSMVTEIEISVISDQKESGIALNWLKHSKVGFCRMHLLSAQIEVSHMIQG